MYRFEYAPRSVGAPDCYRSLTLSTEIEAIKQLGRHANVLKIYGCIKWEEQVYLFQERCFGTIESYVSQFGYSVHDRGADSGQKVHHLASSRCVEFMRQLLEVVVYMHSKQVQHRYLRLASVLVGVDLQTLKVRNFNFAKKNNVSAPGDALFRKQVQEALALREPARKSWVAPELVAKETAQTDFAKCDVWALGMIFHFIALGRFPALPKNHEVQLELRDTLLSEDVQQLLARMLDNNPKTRASAQSAKSALERIRIRKNNIYIFSVLRNSLINFDSQQIIDIFKIT